MSSLRGRSQTTFTRFGFFWPPTPLRLHFLWYKCLQKVDFLDHLPPSSCKRSLWTPPKFIIQNWNFLRHPCQKVNDLSLPMGFRFFYFKKTTTASETLVKNKSLFTDSPNHNPQIHKLFANVLRLWNKCTTHHCIRAHSQNLKKMLHRTYSEVRGRLKGDAITA